VVQNQKAHEKTLLEGTTPCSYGVGRSHAYDRDAGGICDTLWGSIR